jgi:hypothetical protein
MIKKIKQENVRTILSNYHQVINFESINITYHNYVGYSKSHYHDKAAIMINHDEAVRFQLSFVSLDFREIGNYFYQNLPYIANINAIRHN